MCNFHRVRREDKLIVSLTTKHRQTLGLLPPPKGFQNLSQKVDERNYLTFSVSARNFCKASLRQRKTCLEDFSGETLLAQRLLLSRQYLFRNVCLPYFFPAVLKVNLPVAISVNSCAGNSSKSSRTVFAAATSFSNKTGCTILLKTCAGVAISP